MVSIETDIFDSTIPNAKRVEEMVETSIMQNYDTKIKNIRTISMWVEDQTR